ncbi:hypothetical protein [Nocardioides sp. MH1]|uniref:hypothetical protein n=1 Tax=Nocardioides sp. MH1 TaxID=3242490 RepID=UPI00352092D6
MADLCFAELAWARQAGVVATEHDAADALDLRHRLPRLLSAVVGLEVDAWVGRKIARMTRRLPADRVGVVDAAIWRARLQPPGELLRIAEAKIIEADPAAHRARLEEDARRTGVWLSRVRPGEVVEETGEPATRRISAKLPTGAAVRGHENVEDLAEALYEHSEADAAGDRPSIQECRTAAFEMLLTAPEKAAAFLATQDTDPTHPDPSQPGPDEVRPVKRRRDRRPAQVIVHVTDLVLCGILAGVARVEDFGPILIDQLGDLLRDRDVEVLPVVDLNKTTRVSGYEHPTLVKQRTLLRTGGDVFPHSTSRGLKRLDHDHPHPYDPDGPAGQTGDHNDAPLTRRHHRAKTHLAYRCDQLDLAVYRWSSPHGLARLVTPTGTHRIRLLHTPDQTRPVGEVYTDGPRINLHLRT